MAKRKYVTEMALGFFSKNLLLLHPKDIKTLEKETNRTIVDVADDCHIYLIVVRPRISFVPGSIVVGEEFTRGLFRYYTNGVAKDVAFSLSGKPNADSVEISSYPHSSLSLIKNGEEVRSYPAHLVSMMCDHIDDLSIRDLQVVYVGKSYADGKRSAKDRLLSHSTLQQVLADLNNDSPDMEALIVMVQYEPPQIMMSFDGRDKTVKLEDDRNIGADVHKLETLITEDIEISLIEAGLIKYFAPLYNDKYKESFPHPSHQILKQVYEIDFGALTVEINTEELNGRLFSKERKPGYHHIASVDLFDPAVRRSFFNIMGAEQGFNAPDQSGPAY